MKKIQFRIVLCRYIPSRIYALKMFSGRWLSTHRTVPIRGKLLLWHIKKLYVPYKSVERYMDLGTK